MKKIAFSLMVLVIVLATACNQGSKNNSDSGNGPGGGDFNAEERVDGQLEELTELLDLSKSQEKQMREVMMDGMDESLKMREEMRSGNGDFEAIRGQMREVREAQNLKVKEILSEEQWEKYDTYQKKRGGRRGQGRPQ